MACLPEIITITKENPVWLYRIVLTANKAHGNGSYKEFVCIKAWSNKNNDVLKSGLRKFDFYYKNRIYRNQEVGINEGVVYSTKNLFNIWFKEKNDDKALEECKKWLAERIDEKAIDVRNQAWRLFYDRQFIHSLDVCNGEDTK